MDAAQANKIIREAAVTLLNMQLLPEHKQIELIQAIEATN